MFTALWLCFSLDCITMMEMIVRQLHQIPQPQVDGATPGTMTTSSKSLLSAGLQSGDL